MQFTLLYLLFVPLIEIYFMIKIGAFIGAFNTIMATLLTAGVGLYFVKQQGLATVMSAINSISRNNSPVFEILGGFCLVIAAICLIIPGFITDIIGALLVFPLTRNLILKIIVKQNNQSKNNNDKVIEIEADEIDERKE